MRSLVVPLIPLILGGVFAGASCGAVAAEDAETAPPVVLVKDGASGYTIAVSPQASPAETYAAAELAEFVRRATGVDLPVVAESALAEGPAIQVGWTAFARAQGIGLEALGEEEWILRTAGQNLLLVGGRPRGTLYAVYEFLESVLGVRFLDARTEHVPEHAELAVPAAWDIRGEPAFARREIGWGRGLPFDVRLRINSFANAWRQVEARYGYAIKYGSPYTTHTHHRYVKDFPDLFDQPGFFALTERGGRDTQLCMSHPEVRKRFGVALRRYIARDRQAIRDAKTGEPPPRHYSLVPDDGSSGKCVCERCLALVDRYGSYAGVVLEFTNEIAEDIARDEPDLVLVTGAYTYYRDIPNGIRPRENVMTSIAQLGAEFNTFPKRDTLRSMLHPLNEGPRREWEAWSKISPRLGVHDYWTPWQQPLVWPYANVRGTAETITFYRRCGLEHFFVEAAIPGSRIYSFADLQYYVGSRLLLDPQRPVEALIDEFCRLYYGPAASAMRGVLEILERRAEEEPGMLAAVPPRSRAYYDRSFFLETDALLTEAEMLAEGDADVAVRVRQERLPLDETLLFLWDAFAGKGDWPFERAAVAERLERVYEGAYAKYGGRSDGRVAADKARLAYLRSMPPIPAQFAGRQVLDFCGPLLVLCYGNRVPRRRTDDPEAACGKSWRIAEHVWTADRSARHDLAPEFGLSDLVQTPKISVKRRLEPAEIPADECYHWHFVGRMRASPTMYFYAHHSWVFDMRLLQAYNAALPEQKEYDVYVSLKLEGPSYVPGSTKPDAFSIDRLLLAEAGPGTALTEGE